MRKVTIKIGSSVLLTKRNKLDEFRIAHIADQIASLKKKGVGVVLVVSGAVACGAKYIQFSFHDKKLKMAAAGIGQAYLNSAFQKIFSRKGLRIAQILLTKDLLDSKRIKEGVNDLIQYYLQIGVVPVINENDVIDLNSFGGNDFLGARVAALIEAESLLILSTMTGSKFGIGGGETKLQAMAMLNQENIQASIVDGKNINILLKTIL